LLYRCAILPDLKRKFLLIFCIAVIAGCSWEPDMSRYVPDYFPVEKLIYSKGCISTGINVFQIKSDFYSEFIKKIYLLNLPNSLQKKHSFRLQPWQETPINTNKLHDVAKAWGTISSTKECLDDDSYKDIFSKSLRNNSYFTTESGLLLIYNYQHNLLFISKWD
jgi:hypothetical protein